MLLFSIVIFNGCGSDTLLKKSVKILNLSLIASSPSNSNTAPNFLVSNVDDGALVSLYTDNQCTEVNKVVSGTASSDSIELTVALSNDGVYTYYAKQVSGTGTISSCSNGVSYILDTMVAMPTLSLVTSSPSSNPTPTFSLGSLEVEGNVRLYSDDSCNTLVQDSIEITEESMEIDLSTALLNYDTYTYSTKQTDRAGNLSNCSSAISYEFIDTSFESVWHVGSSRHGDGNRSVTLPLRENDGNGKNFEYDFTVDWGDDSQPQAITAYSADITHNYEHAGKYTIKITGPKFPAWYFNSSGDKNKIIEVKNLGIVGWKNLASSFHSCLRRIYCWHHRHL